MCLITSILGLGHIYLQLCFQSVVCTVVFRFQHSNSVHYSYSRRTLMHTLASRLLLRVSLDGENGKSDIRCERGAFVFHATFFSVRRNYGWINLTQHLLYTVFHSTVFNPKYLCTLWHIALFYHLNLKKNITLGSIHTLLSSYFTPFLLLCMCLIYPYISKIWGKRKESKILSVIHA